MNQFNFKNTDLINNAKVIIIIPLILHISLLYVFFLEKKSIRIYK